MRLIPTAIFEKEVRSQGRRWGTYLGRGLYATLMLGLLLIVFFGVTEGRGRSGGGARALQELQELAPGLTMAVLWFQYVMLALMGPLLAGPSICDERRTGTLATLLTTPLTAGQIVIGKLLSALVQIVILAALATPMLLVIRVFGGVPVEIIFAGLALAISTSVLGAALAIGASVRAKRGTMASVTGFVYVMALHLGPIMVLGILSLWPGAIGGRATWMTWGFVTCGPAVMGVLSSELFGGGGPAIGLGSTSLWVLNCAYSLALAGLAVFWAIVRLRRVMVAVGAGAPAVPTKRKAKRAPAVRRGVAGTTAGAPAAVVVDTSEPMKREGRERGEVSDQPVLWRELRQPLFARARDFWIITVALVSIMAGIMLKFGVEEAELYLVPVVIGMFIVLIQASTHSSSAVTGEREGRTWEVLLTTGLSAWGILVGKTLGSLKKIVYVPAMVALLLCTVGLWSGLVHPAVLPLILLVASAPVIFLTCTGVLASLVFKRSVHAAAANIGLALALWVGLPIVVRLLNLRNPDTFLTLTNPMMVIAAATEGGIHEPPALTLEAMRFHGPMSGSMRVWEFTSYVVLYWVAYVGAGLGALAAGVAVFNARTGRSS